MNPIQPDIEEAIEYFLDEVPVSDYLKEMRDFIIACSMCTIFPLDAVSFAYPHYHLGVVKSDNLYSNYKLTLCSH